MARPPRLIGITYRGFGTYFLTVCVAVSAYCFMPDHLHLLAIGTEEWADIPGFVRRSKQVSSHAHVQLHARPLWQPGYFDRVLREDEDPLVVTAYMVANPLRAGLTTEAGTYPFWGSEMFSREEILEAIATMTALQGWRVRRVPAGLTSLRQGYGGPPKLQRRRKPTLYSRPDRA